MWALFTAALKAGSSATKVSVVNISSNFLVSAGLGWAVFGEKLGGVWALGAGMLVGGSVVMSRRESERRRGEGEGYVVVGGDESEEEVEMGGRGSGSESGDGGGLRGR